MQEILQHIAIQQNWQIQQVKEVSGGDINEALSLQTDKGRFFLKLNNSQCYPGMFESEADGLNALQQHFPLKVPTVIATGEVSIKQYLLLEWLQQVNCTTESWEFFGKALARLHQNTHSRFGWHRPNYLGSIQVQNGWCKNWAVFYSVNRILPLVRLLRDKSIFSVEDTLQAEAFCKNLPDRMPIEPPALLHGDLWSGNASAVSVAGFSTVAIYDPAVYYGHREIDIALTCLFGKFPNAFYAAYNKIYPLQTGWQQRLPLFQLSHLLLHAVLFGGSYTNRCREIMK